MNRMSESFYLKNLIRKGVSNLTQKHLDVRYSDGDYTIQNSRIQVENNDLYIYFKINNTFTAKAVTVFNSDGSQKQSTHYSVIFEVEDFFDPIDKDFLDLDQQDQIDIVADLIDKSPMRVWANDPSYYYQGRWEAQDKRDNSVFPFPGPKGKDIWLNRHKASGGLGFEPLFSSKHIIQCANEMKDHIPIINSRIITHLNQKYGSKNKNRESSSRFLDLVLNN